MKQTVGEFVQNHHFEVRKETIIKCGASKRGLGAALEPFHPDGWKPVLYASRFLNEAELKYSVNDVELLAVVWPVTHYQNYLFGAPLKTIKQKKHCSLVYLNKKVPKQHRRDLFNGMICYCHLTLPRKIYQRIYQGKAWDW